MVLFLAGWRVESRRGQRLILSLVHLLFAISMLIAWVQPGGGSQL